jgi:hypothetical protein
MVDAAVSPTELARVRLDVNAYAASRSSSAAPLLPSFFGWAFAKTLRRTHLGAKGDRSPRGDPLMAKRQTVHVCSGKRCVDHPKRRQELVSALEGVANVDDCGCVKICHGPVAGLLVDGQLEWFRGLHSGKSIKQLRKLVKAGKLSQSLAKLRVPKRSGKKPAASKG